MRLFVAVNLPPAVRAAVWEVAEPLRMALPDGIAWVREEALHVTLRFLGERPPPFVDELAARLRTAVAPVPPLEITLASVGAFPSMRRPRVLWFGGPANSALTQLYQEVARVTAALGVEPEPRSFRLHVTVGRVRQGARVDVAALARGTAAVVLQTAFSVATVDVMQSELGPGGTRYRVVAAVPFGNRGE